MPDDFRFGFKVTDEITTRKFPNLERFGAKAGQANRDFLNADLFATAFLKPCEYIRRKIGVLMFEFSRFYPTDYEHGREFVADLDTFLGKWAAEGLAVRRRDAEQALAGAGVFRVPGAAWRHARVQFVGGDAVGAGTDGVAGQPSESGKLVAARFLLKPGRKYGDAVKSFQPYDTTKEIYPEAREAGRALIQEGERYGAAAQDLHLREQPAGRKRAVDD